MNLLETLMGSGTFGRELGYVLKGMAGTNPGRESDIANREAAAWRRQPDYVDPETVMSMPNSSEPPPVLMSQAPAAPVSEAPPMSVGSGMHPAAKAAPMAAGGQPKGRAPAPAPQISAQPAALEAAPVVEDMIAKMLAGRRGDAEGERDSAKAKAAAAKDLSDGEKIFTALMAVMPGLVGAIGGGAIAGGHGAAAGAAGGLSGGANAVGAMMGEKEQLRQEALAEALAAQKRVDDVGAQELGHSEKLQTQDFQVGERKAGEQFAVANREDQQEFNASESAKTRKHSDKQMLQRMRHEAHMQQLAMEQKVQAAAMRGDVELKDYQGKSASFAATMLLAKDALDEMRDPGLWNTMATWGGYRNALADPKRQKYARAVYNYLDSVTRDVSGAAITPEDWDVKFKQYMALQGSSPEDLQYAQQFRDTQIRMMLQKAGPGAKMALQAVQESVRPPVSEISDEDRSNAMKWLESQDPNDPTAKAVRARLGV